jgi:cell division protein FtsI/penicillin-binding protein 2
MLTALLDWGLRAILLLFGIGSAIALARWIRATARERRERWTLRIAFAMLGLALVYAGGHAWLLWNAEAIEEGRMAWRRWGDPREAERTRGEVRGWILDCTGRPGSALARYGVRDGTVERVYPLGEGGANLIGGGAGADERDFTVERVFASRLRRPRDFMEAGELHPAGTDLQLTLCAAPTRHAWNLLNATGMNGAVIVQEVSSGALVAYAATGGPGDAAYGIRRYAPPGSVFKLALAAVWWEGGLGDTQMPCPSEIQAGRRAIRNFESGSYGSIQVPREMLKYSCNTAAVQMAMTARDRLGADSFRDAFQRFGFTVYDDRPPAASDGDFWNTDHAPWARRMAPPSVRVRVRERIDLFEWGQVAIGQGPVDVTPIGVSRFVQAIGNGGVMLPVTLESERLDDLPDGRRIMQETTSRRLQEAMLTVVDSGTARSAPPRYAGTGWDLGGKTGSADVAGRPRADGWFAGLIYDDQRRPRYTIVVYLQSGSPGGRLPTAIAGDMVRFMATQEAEAAGERS